MCECTVGCDVLRAMYKKLTTMLDARIVAVHMYQRNALTLKELQSIRALRDRPVAAAETLLNIIMGQPDAVYLCFLDVLKHTKQHHIYQRLLQDGYQGKCGNIFSRYKYLFLPVLEQREIGQIPTLSVCSNIILLHNKFKTLFP